MATTKTVLINGETFQFKDIVLHGTLENWNDQLGVRVANHKYLKRNGGEAEIMGIDQRRFNFKCVFISDVTNNYKNLQASIYDNPLGLLIHPRLGKIQVACESLVANEDPANATNALEFNINFIENAVDTVINTSSGAVLPSPQTTLSVMNQALTALSITSLDVLPNGISVEGAFSVLALSARFALRDVLNSFIAVGNTFIQVASDAAASVYQVPALTSQLKDVVNQGNATIAYIKNLGQPDVVMWPIIDNVKVTQASAQNTYNSIIAQKPPVVTFVVPTTMSLRTIAVRLYGPDAQSKIQELLILNKIPYPAAIPMGTILLVSSPTV